MKILLVRNKCTRTTRPRKDGLVLLALALACPTALAAREPGPTAWDTAEATRWASVVPRPTQSTGSPGVWSVGATVLVDFGPVVGPEHESLGERLDLVWGPLGRQWRAARAGESADLVFRDLTGGEGYDLEVRPQGVTISGSATGRYYGLITLGQLLPTRSGPRDAVVAQTGRLSDKPRFPWRGLLLDSSRHLQSVAVLEQVLELMALHKLNRFHWHLTDDQGWRLPVKGWPRLTEVGGWRVEADGRRYGGSYSEDDIRRVVAFAERRHIVVVPEVDLPGHASAALAAYPELSAAGTPREVPLEWGVADGVLSLGRASVTRFTTDVLASLVALFPGPYIHWGGDEVYRNPFLKNAESQAWMRSVKASTPEQAVAAFWNDLARRTLAVGRVPIGWDEVALFAPPAGTVVQWWDDPARAREAFQRGLPVIASWKETTYLDYPEFDGDGDRAFWMPPLTLATVASQPFWPPGTPASTRPQLWGLEATLFTERAPSPKLGRKLFPRLALVAELAWGGVAGGTPGWAWRLEAHRPRLEAWGVGMPPAVR